jgi:WD40 repeat protein
VSAIFISHSSRDAAVSKEVMERLHEQGHRSVFLDFDPENGIPAGRDWEQELYRRLRACQAVIVLCSEHSMSSHWCFAEITHAKALGKQVFPVKVAPCEIDPVLTSRQVLDLTADREEAYARLQRGLVAAGLDPADAFDWDGSRPPYPGLLAFQEEDAGIFFGREREVHDGLQQLRRLQRFGDARMLLVLGASGSGKSSLVRAGLLPRLRRSAEGWIVLDPFRPGDDPFRELAGVLSHALRAAGRPRPWREIHAHLRSAPAAELPALPRESAPSGHPPDADRALTAALETLEAVLRERDDPEAARHLVRLRSRLGRAGGAGELDPGPPPDPPEEADAGEAGPLLALLTDLRLGARRAGAQVLLTVDQLEELFGHIGKPGKHPANAFLRQLRAALDTPGGPVVLLATMRSDYLGELQRSPELLGLRFETLSLGPMAPEGVAQTVERPARAAGVELEPGLTEALVEDARGEETLPLLAFTLRELWECHGEDGRLTVSEYRDSLGGLSGSVARAADGVLGEGLPAGTERDLRRAFLQMVRLGDGGAYVRHPARWRDLPAGIHGLLERFVAARLLVSRDESGERVLEVAHEALFRSWGRLRDWLDEDRELLLWRRRLRTALDAWRETQRDEGALLRGVALAEAERWLAERPESLEEEREFIETSAAEARRRAEEKRMLRRRIVAGSVAAAVVCLALATVAWLAYLDARRLTLEQRAGLVVEAAYDLRDPLVGALLVLESAELLDGEEPAGGAAAARNNLGFAIASSVLRGHGDAVSTVAFSPDGASVVTASEDGTARIWRSDGAGLPVVLSGHEGEVTAAWFSPDGSRVVTASRDGTAWVWSVGGPSESIESPRPVVLDAGRGELVAAAWSPDGARVLLASRDGTALLWSGAGAGDPAVLRSPGGDAGEAAAALFDPDGSRVAVGFGDGSVRVWPMDGPEDGGAEPVVLAGHTGPVTSLDFSPDGARLVTASRDGTARVWRLDGPAGPVEPQVLAGHRNWVWRAVFSHDGTLVATASADNTARIWPVDGPVAGPASETIEPTVLQGHKDWVREVAFSPDDSLLLTASHDGDGRLWWVDGGTPAARLTGHEGWVRGAAFSHDGARVATASDDGTARVWDAHTTPDPLTFEGHQDQVWDARPSPDGKRLVSASADLTARVWNASGEGRPLTLRGHTERLRSASFSPDGSRVLTSSDDGTARIWNADGEGEPVVLRGHADKVLDARWSHDGGRVVTASYDGTVRLWSAAGEPLGVLEGHQGWVRSAVFSRDGTRVLTASADRTIGIFEVDGTAAPVFLRGHGDQVMTAAFSPDESKIVSASADRTVRVWPADGSAEPLVLEGHEGPVWSAAFSPDGTRIVSASQDWSARVWTVEGTVEGNADGGQGPVLLEGHEGPVWAAVFGPDGERIVTSSADGVVRVFRLWRLSWPELLEELDASTDACIVPDHRVRYLMESPERARERFEACERAAGRAAETSR